MAGGLQFANEGVDVGRRVRRGRTVVVDHENMHLGCGPGRCPKKNGGLKQLLYWLEPKHTERSMKHAELYLGGRLEGTAGEKS